ncbi:hypothetical protein CEUSTIGMA_g12206.t1 [Chlamydomonas eustigma]|uniref:Uncharacterized protein n=1 Tax=Chlamydomonas eustigma TaxID=1157962 RepID=A0A250XNW5_9CHLO|nr:hypothetical protein CEUSTIGMA_g12206.t1 [Chlamydomonas eustigma]|eukprot:GAX84784.1 hypothetical protein CEUSTIGMA_g12206.t1 [Chlamydomonas eustigma]
MFQNKTDALADVTFAKAATSLPPPYDPSEEYRRILQIASADAKTAARAANAEASGRQLDGYQYLMSREKRVLDTVDRVVNDSIRSDTKRTTVVGMPIQELAMRSVGAVSSLLDDLVASKSRSDPKEVPREQQPREIPREQQPREIPREQQPIEQQPREVPREQQPREIPREQQPREQQPREQQPRDAPREQQPRDAPREQQPQQPPKEVPREPSREQQKGPQNDQRGNDTRSPFQAKPEGDEKYKRYDPVSKSVDRS